MPLPPISVPLFPDIPNVPGVPPLNRAPSYSLDARFSGVGGLPLEIGLALVAANTPSGLRQIDGPNLPQPVATAVWGVFDAVTGLPVALADTIISIEYRNEYRISNYPQEDGAFASYNKVASPYDARIRMAKGGSPDDRGTFLDALSFALSSLNFYAIVTPEVTYTSAQIVSLDYKREQRNGANFLIVDLLIEEVRITATITFTNTKQISGEDAHIVGSVQAVPFPATYAPPAPR